MKFKVIQARDSPTKIAQCYRVDVSDPLIKEESQQDIPISHSILTLNKGIYKKVEHGEITDIWNPGHSFLVGTIQVFHHQDLKVRSMLGLKHDLGGVVKGKQDYKTSIPLTFLVDLHGSCPT